MSQIKQWIKSMVEGAGKLGVYNSQTLGPSYNLRPGSEYQPGVDLLTSLYGTQRDVIKYTRR